MLNADRTMGDSYSSSPATSSSSPEEGLALINYSDFFASVRNHLSEFSERFMPSSTRASHRPRQEGASFCRISSDLSPTLKDDNDTTGESPVQAGESTQRTSPSTRSVNKKQTNTDNSQVTAEKLAMLEAVLSKRLPPQKVMRFVTECRNHAQIHGHTGVLDDLLKSPKINLG